MCLTGLHASKAQSVYPVSTTLSFDVMPQFFTLAAKLDAAPTMEDAAQTWDVGSGPDSSVDEDEQVLEALGNTNGR